MAVMWNLSLSPWLDENGDPMVGAKAYFFDATTTTPQAVYTTAGLDVPHDHPVLANGSGRFPAVFHANPGGTYRLRITDADDVTIWDVDTISVPVSEPPEIPEGDTPTELLARTGDLKPRYGTGSHSGWVRANGRSLGDASSGGTERANADAEDLFLYLWPFTELSVSGGRGVSAAADWAASKAITLPDFRGRALVGLDGMGNSRGNVITSGAGDTLGTGLGAETVTLSVSEMPAHDHGGVTNTNGAHAHTAGDAVLSAGFGGTALRAYAGLGGGMTTTDGDHSHAIGSQGGGAAHNNLQPSRLITIYIKL